MPQLRPVGSPCGGGNGFSGSRNNPQPGRAASPPASQASPITATLTFAASSSRKYWVLGSEC
ncbi:hypothetical protein MKX07_007550 [Trichoderma sp. CBMAI-0711]|nr:hypothetical protein MKX07_007550 [Trichoderma sp. CBMAI-0711]